MSKVVFNPGTWLAVPRVFLAASRSLTRPELDLYLALLDSAGGFRRTVELANRHLQTRSGINRPNTFHSARRKLADLGLISFTPGGKRGQFVYTLLDGAETAVDEAEETGTWADVPSEVLDGLRRKPAKPAHIGKVIEMPEPTRRRTSADLNPKPGRI